MISRFFRLLAAILRAPPVVVVRTKARRLPSKEFTAAWGLAYQAGLQRGLTMNEAFALADEATGLRSTGAAD